MIAHRLSTIRPAHKILVITNGEIIEAGSHDEFMALEGFYHDLFMTQFRGLASTSTPTASQRAVAFAGKVSKQQEHGDV